MAEELFEQKFVDVVLDVAICFVAADHSYESSCVMSANSQLRSSLKVRVSQTRMQVLACQ